MWEAEAAYIHLRGDDDQLLHNRLLHPLKRLAVSRVGTDWQDFEVTSNRVDEVDRSSLL